MKKNTHTLIFLKQKIIPAWIVLSLIMGQSVSKVGTTASQFLKIGVGSRAISMGGAFTAIANDASAAYWNPAGAVYTRNLQALFDHTDWFLDINHEFVSALLSFGNMGTFGVTISYVHMGEMLVTTTRDPEGETGEKFRVGSYSGMITYARKLTDRFSVGFNGKFINDFIYNSSASGFAIDVGTLYQTQWDGFMLGMSISNFGTKMQMTGRDLLIQTDLDPGLHSDPEHLNSNLATDRFDLPLLFRFGVSYTHSLLDPRILFTFALDALHPNDNTESLNLGSELNFGQRVFLRGGWRHLGQKDAEDGLTLGGGVHVQLGGITYQLDYSWQQFGLLGNPQKISISMTY